MPNIIQQTKDWIEQFVIGYNLCPFAMKPFRDDRIRFVHFEEEDVAQLKEQFLVEALKLRDLPATEVETTLIICPNVSSNFETYLDLFEVMLDTLDEFELDEVIQLASFHPDYQFADTDYEAPENFTNRSPYPMIHLLRVDSVARAIETYPDTANIPVNNIARMQQIGSEELIKRYHEIIGKN
jgi:hypothetical protein